MAGFLSGVAGGATVAIVIKAVDEFSTTISKAESSFSGLATSSLAIGTAVATSVGAAVFTLTKLAQEAAKAGDIQDNFNKIAGKDGPKLLKDLQDATIGTIDKFTLMRAANQALTRGVSAETIPTLAKYAQRAIDAGLATGNATDVIDQLSRAMATGRTVGLAQIGIVVDQKKAYIEYAKTLVLAEAASRGVTLSEEGLADRIKKTVSALTEDQKSQAERVALLDEVRRKTEALGTPTIDTADKVAQMSAKFTEFKVALGTAVAPAINQLIDSFMALLPVIQEQLLPVIVQTAPAFIALVGAVVPLLPYLAELARLVLYGAEAIAVGLGGAIDLIKTSFAGWYDLIMTIIGAIQTLIDWVKDLIKYLAQISFGAIDKAANFFGGNKNKSKNVNDFILRPDGTLLKTNPMDTIFGMKNPDAMQGGQSIVFNIDNVYGVDPKQISRALSNELYNKVSI